MIKVGTRIFLLFYLLSISLVNSAQVMDEEVYISGEIPDSIVFLSSNKTRITQLSEEQLSTMSNEEIEKVNLLNRKIRAALDTSAFPLNNYRDYFEIYETQKSISEESEIRKLLELFPVLNCGSLPSQSRCSPIYRDCMIFFKHGRPFFALKICFSCSHVVSTPDTHEARCLAEKSTLTNIMHEWVERGLIDIYER